MSYDQLIGLYFERANALQWYWTLYVVIIGGLLAFSSLRQRGDLLTVCLISVLYVFFAYKNLGAIHDVIVQQVATLDAMHQYVPAVGAATGVEAARRLIEPTLITPAYGGVRNFHVTCDVLTIAAIWGMEWRRRRAVKAGPVAT